MTTLLKEIFHPDALDDMIREGYVRVRVHPDDPRLKIYNYTDKAQIHGVWNKVTRECRGLIVEEHGDTQFVLARPFAKFFNLSEYSEGSIPRSKFVRAYDKVDGSLGILYPAPDGLPAIATRGSFESPQALHATKIYRERYHDKWDPAPGETFLFEIVFPENRIVLDYGEQDDLILLGSRTIMDGEVLGSYVGDWDGWPGPKAEKIFEGTLAKALELGDRQNAEGMVLHIVGDDMMVKVKQDDYVALHRIVFGLSEKTVWEQMLENKDVDEICDGLPDEFHDWVKKVYARLDTESGTIMRAASAAFLRNNTDHPDRKTFAERAKASPYPGIQFLMLDGKFDEAALQVLKMVKPQHNTYDENRAAA